MCLALQAEADAATRSGKALEARGKGAESRRWLLWSMVEPEFRFDPLPDLLTRDDVAVVRRQRFSTIFETKFWHPTAESHSGPHSLLFAAIPSALRQH